MSEPEKAERLQAYLAELAGAESHPDRIAAAMKLANTARILEHEVIGEARSAGITWQQIGDIHQISRQGAFQRFTSHEALVRALEEEMAAD